MEIKETDSLTELIIGCCFQVHNKLGPGFPEKIYANALKLKLQNVGLTFEVEKPYSVLFEDTIVGKFRCDLLIEGKVILELKAVAGYQPKIFQHQLISYLKASRLKTGLLINSET